MIATKEHLTAKYGRGSKNPFRNILGIALQILTGWLLPNLLPEGEKTKLPSYRRPAPKGHKEGQFPRRLPDDRQGEFQGRDRFVS